MTMSMDRTAKFGAGRPCAHGLEANARGTYSSNSSHLSALQLLVDIAARMPLEPQPLVVNVPAHQHQTRPGHLASPPNPHLTTTARLSPRR